MEYCVYTVYEVLGCTISEIFFWLYCKLKFSYQSSFNAIMFVDTFLGNINHCSSLLLTDKCGPVLLPHGPVLLTGGETEPLFPEIYFSLYTRNG